MEKPGNRERKAPFVGFHELVVCPEQQKGLQVYEKNIAELSPSIKSTSIA